MLSRPFVLLTLALSVAVQAAEPEPSTVDVAYRHGSLAVAVGIYRPAERPVADVLYLHGFADSYANHAALFARWNRAGLRVIGFDYPGHGATRGTGSAGSLNGFTMDDLAKIAARVERATREDDRRPLLVAGWSTGGLLAVRLVQTGGLEREPRAALLFAPGVAVRPIVGKQSLRYPLGEVTLETLTHEERASDLLPISPRSPGSVPFFAASLVVASKQAALSRYPRIPTFVAVAGDAADRYVVSRSIRGWARALPGPVVALHCPTARHWLDREPELHGGPEVIEMAGAFAEAAVGDGDFSRLPSGPRCRRFR